MQGRRWSLSARSAVAGREQLTRNLAASIPVRLALAMTCVAVAGVLYLAQASQVSVLEYNTADLQNQQVLSSAQNASLRATAIQLQSLQRVDAAATQQLHMTKPGISNVVWIGPVNPPAIQVRPLNADVVSAQHASRPLAWMQAFILSVKSSL